MDGNQTPILSRRRFLVTGVTAAGGFAIGISALAASCQRRDGGRAALE